MLEAHVAALQLLCAPGREARYRDAAARLQRARLQSGMVDAHRDYAAREGIRWGGRPLNTAA